MVRPVAEVLCCIDVPVDQLAGDVTDELLGQLFRLDQAAFTPVVDLG